MAVSIRPVEPFPLGAHMDGRAVNPGANVAVYPSVAAYARAISGEVTFEPAALDPADPARCMDTSGCVNALNVANPTRL
ncbi:MAG TPA: hypothetical protein VIU11_14285 [Nakamurella sp.]